MRLQAELARLRAEVEKERAGKRSFYELMLQAEYERDEALAQVAALIEAIENSPLDSSDLTRMVAVGALSHRAVDKARALLDRLQRAEAVARDLKEAQKMLAERGIRMQSPALAAWQKGKG